MEGETKILAWHFLPADGKLSNGDGRSVTVGETLSVTGRIECCDRGLHASVSAFDAMQHAPGPIICRVEVWGDLDQESDKVAGRHRKVLWMADASTTLRLFACECAERALTPFESRYPGDARPRQAIEVARRFAMGLASEDELDAARDAARDATRDAARDAWAARDAAWAAAWAAARDAWAARNAAWAAAWAAARDAAEAAVGAAAWAAALDAARDIEYKWQTNRLAEMLDGLASCES